MAELREIRPGGAIPYGARVNNRDIEHYKGPDPASWLTRLGRALLQAAITAEGLQFLVPEVTDFITTPDGGVDASLSIEIPIAGPRPAGLVNSGKTVYQYKWRSKRTAIFQAASGELAKLRDGDALPDYYVLVTNITLSIRDHDRLKSLLRQGCDEFPANRIVLLGASELADRVNNDPQIRIANFGVALGICTLEQARAFAERRYGSPEATPPLFDRQDEISTIQRFLHETQFRALIVYGPQGAGKTRVVLEALSTIHEKVVWARELPAQPAGLIQVLDDSPYLPVLVVDDVEDNPDMLLRKALEAARVKTIVISPWRTGMPGVLELPIKPFDLYEADDFLSKTSPETSPSYRRWLYYQFGGLPGLLIQGGTALAAEIGPKLLQEPRYEKILEAYEARMTRHLDQAATDALIVLSVLPRFTVRPARTGDLEKISEILSIDPGKVLSSLDTLKARNLVEQSGFRDEEYVRVTPPLLAKRIAKRVLPSIAGQLSNLYEQLSNKGRAGLLRRIAEFRDETALRPFLLWLFSETGLFMSLESVAAGSSSVRALAESMPKQTARHLRRVLEDARIDEIRGKLTGDNRREFVRALEVLIHRQDTFDDGAKGLLCLAEAENEHWANSATAIFTQIFHWRYPDIPKDARLRARLLSSLAGANSPERQSLVTKAAAHCLETRFFIWSLGGETVAPPEPGWQATLWKEVHEAVRPIIELLKRFAVDSNDKVRDEAISGLTRGARGILAVGLWGEAIGALEFLATLSLNGSQRANVVQETAYLIAEMRRSLSTIEDDEMRASLQGIVERGEALFNRLTSENFRARFLHWLGPSPMLAHRALDELADYAHIAEEGKRLADEVVNNPALFEIDLQNWVTDEHAENAGYFLRALGEMDHELTWLKALQARLDRPRGVFALALYLAGRSSVAPAEVDSYLDAIAGKGAKWSELAVDATWRMGGSAQGVTRLLRCVTEGGMDRKKVASLLPLGSWHKTVSSDDFLRLVSGLRDGSAHVDWELLEIVHQRWIDMPDEREQLGPVTAELLTNTAIEAPTGRGAHNWDALAAGLADWHVDIGFTLIFAHFQNEQQSRGIFLHLDRAQLLQALSRRDRPRLVRMLFEFVFSRAEGWTVNMELPQLIRPQTDTPVLFEIAEQHGLEAARIIAENLDADQAAFWDMVPEFIIRWGDDEEVREGLLMSMMSIRGVYSDRAATLRPRLERLERLLAHEDPRVQDISAQAKQQLLEEIQRSTQ